MDRGVFDDLRTKDESIAKKKRERRADNGRLKEISKILSKSQNANAKLEAERDKYLTNRESDNTALNNDAIERCKILWEIQRLFLADAVTDLINILNFTKDSLGVAWCAQSDFDELGGARRETTRKLHDRPSI